MHQYRSTRLQGIVLLPPRDYPEDILRTLTIELSFFLEVKETKSNKPQPSWKSSLPEEAANAPGTVPQMHGEDVTENTHRAVEKRPEERRIGNRAKVTLKQLVPKEVMTIVEELLDDMPHRPYRNAQSGIRPVSLPPRCIEC